MENAADEEREEHKDKCALEQPERQLRMEEEEAEEARKLVKEMLKNVDDADVRVEKTRARFSHQFEEYMRKWRREEGRVGFLSVQACRKSQSSDTKSLNVWEGLR